MVTDGPSAMGRSAAEARSTVRGRSAARVAGRTLAVLFAIQGCGDPLPAPSADVSATVSATRDGVVITLAIERASLGTGQVMRARVQVRSVTTEPVLWWGGSCRLDGALTVRPDGRQEPDQGLAWAGEAGRLKALLLSGSMVPAPPGRSIDTDAPAEVGDAVACRADRGFNVLEPGGNLESEVAWPAVDLLSAPLPPGMYQVRATFPWIGPESAVDPALIDLTRDTVPLVAETPLSLAGKGLDLPAGQAVDRLLADLDLARWLAAHPERTWRATSLRWTGDAWLFELRTGLGSDARLSVHGRSGRVAVLELDR